MPQAYTHQELASSSTGKLVVPPQLQSLQTVTDAAPDSVSELAAVCKLLMQLCHPDMTQRIQAQAIVDIAWLKTAAAQPLPTYPHCLMPVEL